MEGGCAHLANQGISPRFPLYLFPARRGAVPLQSRNRQSIVHYSAVHLAFVTKTAATKRQPHYFNSGNSRMNKNSVLLSCPFLAMKSIPIFLCCLMLTAGQPAAAQPEADSMPLRYWQQLASVPSGEELFVHLDKQVYTNNEQIWFNAYFLNRQSPLLPQYEILAVSLISAQTRSVYLESRFLIKDGFCAGNLSLPDTIPPGNYLFTAFGNIADTNGRPKAVYHQLLTIRSVVRNNFKAAISTRDSSNPRLAVVEITATDLLQQPLPKAEVRYTLDGKRMQTGITNAIGCLRIIVPKIATQQVLQARVNQNQEFQLLSATITPLVTDTFLQVRCYPESGQLLSGVANQLLLQVQTEARQPVSTRALLYRNGTVEDTLYTNSSGLCTFAVIPFEQDTLLIELTQGAQTLRYPLPQPVSHAVLIQVPQAFFGDTLNFYLSAALSTEAWLLVHTPEELLLEHRLSLNRQRKKIRFPMEAGTGPQGMLTVSVIDTSGRLLAERLVFRQAQHHAPLQLHTDKTEYTRHEKVTLSLQLDSTVTRELVTASIAVAETNRLLRGSQTDVAIFQQLNGYFPEAPPLHGRALQKPGYLEQLLLLPPQTSVKTHSPTDTPVQLMQLTGTVTIDFKPVKRPTALLLFKADEVAVLETNAEGVFNLPPAEVATTEGKDLTAVLSNNRDQFFQIEMTPLFTNTANRLAAPHAFEHRVPAQAVADEAPAAADIPGIKRLKEIVVQGRRSNLYGASGYYVNECGDYVCVFNILNCQNHFNDIRNRPPQQGERIRVPPNLEVLVPYWGCSSSRNSKSNKVKIRGIYIAREFAGVEQEQKDLAEPEYRSTLFWKPDVVLNPGSSMRFNFLTSDVTGSFKIIVQGITSSGQALYAETTIQVTY